MDRRRAAALAVAALGVVVLATVVTASPMLLDRRPVQTTGDPSTPHASPETASPLPSPVADPEPTRPPTEVRARVTPGELTVTFVVRTRHAGSRRIPVVLVVTPLAAGAPSLRRTVRVGGLPRRVLMEDVPAGRARWGLRAPGGAVIRSRGGLLTVTAPPPPPPPPPAPAPPPPTPGTEPPPPTAPDPAPSPTPAPAPGTPPPDPDPPASGPTGPVDPDDSGPTGPVDPDDL